MVKMTNRRIRLGIDWVLKKDINKTFLKTKFMPIFWKLDLQNLRDINMNMALHKISREMG
jgi:hypothetical protein